MGRAWMGGNGMGWDEWDGMSGMGWDGTGRDDIGRDGTAAEARGWLTALFEEVVGVHLCPKRIEQILEPI